LTVIDYGIFNLVINDNIACMDFNPTGDRYPTNLIISSYERECRYLTRLQKYSWAPEVIVFDHSSRQIQFRWYGNTCEEKLSTNWKEQLEIIVKDLKQESIHKPSFYPKFFYVDNDDRLRAYAFYSASDYSEQPISMNFYRPILNHDRAALVDQLEVDGKLDMKILVEHAFTDYIRWPENHLQQIYYKIHQHNLQT
jgi:hypothetical protein